MAFLMGRALPASPVAPFGLAFLAAVRGAGYGPMAGLPVAFAVLAGHSSVAGLDILSIAWLGVGLLVCQALTTLLHIGKSGPAPLPAAAVALVAAAVPAGMEYGIGGWIGMLFWMSITGVLALVFTLGVVDVASGRLFHMGSTDTPMPMVVVIASALGGLKGLTLFDQLSLADTAAGLVVLICAFTGGPMLGAAAGALLCLGLVFTALGGDMATAALAVATSGMAYVMAGLLCGFFRELGRIGVAVAYVMGLGMLVLLLMDIGQAQVLVASALTAAALFAVMPRRWLAEVPVVLLGASHRLPAKVSGEPPAVLLDRVRHMARVLKEISRTYEQVAVVQAPLEPTLDDVFVQARDRVCTSCSLFQQCWQSEAVQTQAVYEQLWETIDEGGPLAVHNVPDSLERFCIHPDRVAFTLNYLYDIYHARRMWERRLEEGRAVAGDYVGNMARVMDNMVEETGSGKGARPDRGATLKCTAGVARLPKRGGHISGDSYVTAPLSDGRYLMGLSDGMGVGHGAALESRQCIKLLQELLDVGLNTDLAVRTLNSVLLLRSPDDRFATVDFAVMDMATGRAEFVKIGAAPSFVKRGDDVTLVKSATVPAGIVHEVQVEPEHRVLRPGDVVVMLTDGIWEVSQSEDDKERWLMDHLQRESSTDPEEIAESVLAQALEFMPDAADDMTVLAVRITNSGGLPAMEGGQRMLADRWAAVRNTPRMKSKLRRQRGK